HQVAQQLELGGGELDQVAAAAHLVAVLVEAEVADGQGAVGGSGEGAAPAHEPAEPGDDLLEAERLGDVVVAAGGDAGDAVLVGDQRAQGAAVGPLQGRPRLRLTRRHASSVGAFSASVP